VWLFGTKKKKMANTAIKDKESGSTLSISLHPLVIINVSDHFTRERVQKDVPNPRVIGALFGVQTGREVSESLWMILFFLLITYFCSSQVEIMNSFELTYNIVDNGVILDTEFLNQRAEQCSLNQIRFESDEFLTLSFTSQNHV